MMLTEWNKERDFQQEIRLSSKSELHGNLLLEQPDHIDKLERVEKKSEVTEVFPDKVNERVLLPDIDLIKTQSLEAVKQSSIEKEQISVEENDKFRELTEEEKQYLRENTHLSESAINSIYVDEAGKYHLKCRNEELAGNNHEVTGIKYVEKTVIVDDIEITVVVPEFPSVFECEIPAEIWKEGDETIFENCTAQLKNYLETHPEAKLQFNDQQLEQIMNGEAYIKGYTWHHSEIPGKMQLVVTRAVIIFGVAGFVKEVL